MSAKRYTEEFKTEAVKQVSERGHPVVEVASRLGVTTHSLYQWLKRYRLPPAEQEAAKDQQAEIRRLKSELKRVTEERDILKKGRRVLCQGVRVRYAFIRDQRAQHTVRRRCRMMSVQPSGYYVWQVSPLSARSVEERIRRKIYSTREEARRDVFNYIEMFYNPKRRHGYNNRLSPVDYEKQYFERLGSV